MVAIPYEILSNHGYICAGATLEGKITVGQNTIVHPGAIIKATKGEIIFGNFNVVEERVLIENTNEDGSPLVIGNDNTFKVRSRFRGKAVGDGNHFGVFSHVGEGVEIGDNCFLGPFNEHCDSAASISDGSVFYCRNNSRTSTEPPQSNKIQTELLKRCLPACHRQIKM